MVKVAERLAKEGWMIEMYGLKAVDVATDVFAGAPTAGCFLKGTANLQGDYLEVPPELRDAELQRIEARISRLGGAS